MRPALLAAILVVGSVLAGPVSVARAGTVADGLSVAGDFRGNGRSQIAALYDPNDDLGLRIDVLEQVGTAEPLARTTWLLSGPNAFDLARMKVAATDVDRDGKADLVVLYDDGGTSVRLLVFRSTGSSFAFTGVAGWWRSDGYAFSRVAAMVAGMFSGGDRNGLLLVYQYDDFQMRIHYLESDGKQFLYGGDAGVYDSGPGQYDTGRARFVVGHFTRAGGPDQIAALYQYPGYRVRTHVFDPTPTGLQPVNGWAGVADTGEGVYDLGRAQVVAGDLDGDGRTDIAALYLYDDGSVRAHLFPAAKQLALASTSGLVTIPQGALPWSGTRLVAGDWNGDGKADLATLSSQIDGTTHAAVLRSSGTALAFAPDAWVTPPGEARTAACLTCWPLTGRPQAGGDSARRPLVVKIDNAPQARPQVGFGAADMILELLAEGNITRYAAVFQERDPDVIGPVRSARFSDRYTTPMFRAGLAYSGASTEITALIRQDAGRGRYLDLDANIRGAAYYRDLARESPHNLFTSGDRLRAAAGTAGGNGPVAVPRWRFFAKPSHEPTAGGMSASVAATRLTIPYREDRALVRYQYDEAARRYARWQNSGGVPVRTTDAADGAPIAATNVVVVFTDIFDSGLRDSSGAAVLDMRLTGGGGASIFRDGRRLDGSWSRATVFEAFSFTTRSGEPVLLSPGQTWVHVIPTDWVVPSS
ncbi:MAG: DUF3048 domain-containing protein [Candidatus Limnocylindria bacterium]|nr:DUF3048 domain-containing protein [Candidatus Limnocylindria bacterium]